MELLTYTFEYCHAQHRFSAWTPRSAHPLEAGSRSSATTIRAHRAWICSSKGLSWPQNSALPPQSLPAGKFTVYPDGVTWLVQSDQPFCLGTARIQIFFFYCKGRIGKVSDFLRKSTSAWTCVANTTEPCGRTWFLWLCVFDVFREPSFFYSPLCIFLRFLHNICVFCTFLSPGLYPPFCRVVMARINRPAPVEVCYKNMRFLITHNPTNATLNTFIEVSSCKQMDGFWFFTQIWSLLFNIWGHINQSAVTMVSSDR